MKLFVAKTRRAPIVNLQERMSVLKLSKNLAINFIIIVQTLKMKHAEVDNILRPLRRKKNLRSRACKELMVVPKHGKLLFMLRIPAGGNYLFQSIHTEPAQY